MDLCRQSVIFAFFFFNLFLNFIIIFLSLLFNTLSRFLIAFLPRRNHLLTSWLQSPSGVILEPRMRKSVVAFTFSPSIYHKVTGPDAMIFVVVQFLSRV